MKRLLILLPLLLPAQQVDYNTQVKSKPSLTTINGGSLPSTGAITKIDSGGHLAAAVAGTDYALPTALSGLPFLHAKTDCGLVMNGSTDDTSALNTCIGTLPAGGGAIVFPVGVSIIGNLTITKNNVHLIGQGMRSAWTAGTADNGSTQLKYPATGTVGGFVIRFTGSGGYTNQGSSIERMTLNANSVAATALWLTDTYLFSANTIAMDSNIGGYALVIDATGITTVPKCGDGSGAIFLDNYLIWTGMDAGGISLGTATRDVCSIKAGKGFIEWSGHLPYAGIFAQHVDSSTFQDTTIMEITSTGTHPGVTGSASCTSLLCTVTTSEPHGMRPVQAVWLLNSTRTELQGTFSTAATGASQFIFYAGAGLPDGTYTLGLVGGASLELGTSSCYASSQGCAWDNHFGNLITGQGVFEYDYYGHLNMTFNSIDSWNWIETGLVKPHSAYTNRVPSTDVRGSFWNARFATGAKFGGVATSPYAAKPQATWLSFDAGSVADYGYAIDFNYATPVTSAGYMPIRLRNSTYMGTRNAADSSDIVLLGANSSGSIIMGSTFNPAGTRVIFANQPQLFSQTAPTCDATTRGTFNYLAGGAGVKDSVQVCGKDSSDNFAWRTVY